MPRSTPTTRPERDTGSRSGSSTENATCHRPRWCDRVTERMRAVPTSRCRASLRVDSCVRTRPITGSATWRRSGPRPNDPVVNRQVNRVRCFDLNRGILVRPALRLPSAVARFAQPDAYASLLFSDHHGATCALVVFHALRRL